MYWPKYVIKEIKETKNGQVTVFNNQLKKNYPSTNDTANWLKESLQYSANHPFTKSNKAGWTITKGYTTRSVIFCLR